MAMPCRSRSRLFALACVLAGGLSAQRPEATAALRQLALPPAAGLAADRALELSAPPPPAGEGAAASAAALANKLAAAVAGEHRTIDQVTAAADGSIDGLFLFVRDRIGTAVYPGVLRSAQGTLDARCGNAADKALLLAALLQCAGWKTRFASGELPPERVAMLVARQFEPRAASAADLVPGWLQKSWLQSLSARARRDHAVVRPQLDAELVTLARRLAADAAANEIAAAQHVWLQVEVGSEWRDLDPNFADAAVGDRCATAAATMAGLPAELHQRLTIRVRSELLDGERTTSATALEVQLPVHELADRDLFLLHVPTGSGGAVGDLIAGKKKGDYAPALLVGAAMQLGTAVPFAPAGSSGSFRDLAGGLAGGEEAPAVLVAEWLEFELAIPGRPVRTMVRALLDRVPPAVRATGRITADGLLPIERDASGRPLATMALHQLLVSSGAHDFAAITAGNAARAAAGSAPDEAVAEDFIDACRLLAAGNRYWQVLADTVLVPALDDLDAVRAVFTAPRVSVLTIGVAAGESVFLRSDLVLQDVGLVARDAAAWPAAASRRIWHGLLEGALEHEFVRGRMAPLSTIAAPSMVSVSAGVEAAPPLVLRSGADAAISEATKNADLAARLRASLAAGSLLVVPRSTLAAGRALDDAAWWQLHADGTLRAVLGADHGGAAVDLPSRGSYGITDMNRQVKRSMSKTVRGGKGGNEYQTTLRISDETIQTVVVVANVIVYLIVAGEIIHYFF